MKRKTLFLGAVPFLVLNGFFVANLTRYPELRKYADRSELAVVSAVFVVIFALPSFLATLRWLGARRGAAALVALGAFAFFIETLALNTGVPYGAFSYGEKIGAKLPGGVPWTVAFAWAPLILGSYFWAHRVCQRANSRLGFAAQRDVGLRRRKEKDAASAQADAPRSASRAASSLPSNTRVLATGNVAPQNWKIIALTALFATLCDGVLDPGAVSQNFWTYRNDGAYYGVPLSNYCGWLLSGIIGAAILHAFATGANLKNAAAKIADNARNMNAPDAAFVGADAENAAPQNPPSMLLGSAFLILTFWTSIAFFSALWIPFFLGVTLLIVIARDFFLTCEYSHK